MNPYRTQVAARVLVTGSTKWVDAAIIESMLESLAHDPAVRDKGPTPKWRSGLLIERLSTRNCDRLA